MVQIVGQYQHLSYAPNFESYLKALGVPEATILSVVSLKPILTISENNGQWTFHNSYAENVWSSTFQLGEPFNEQLVNGDFLQSVARHEGDKLIIESTVHNAKDTKIYEFNETGINMHVSNLNVGDTTSVVYKRV